MNKIMAKFLKERHKNSDYKSGEIEIHRCSMCDYPCGYVIAGIDNIYYDNGCYCTNCSGAYERSYEDIAEDYNMQSQPNSITENIEEFFKFKPKEG